MKKKQAQDQVIKTVIHQSTDNSVELYTLTRGENVETYLRRGGSTELVTGDVDLNFTPEEPEHKLNFRTLVTSANGWNMGNGIPIHFIPKTKR